MKRALVLFTTAVAVAACGGAGYGVNASAPAAPAAKARTAAKVRLRHTSLGQVLVDAKGRTLYLFRKDKRRKSRCSGACAANWPPLMTKGHPRAGAGVVASRLGSIRRKGGGRQVTYFGHPLYRYVGDFGPGDTSGQGVSAFGAKWFAVQASGTRAGAAPAPMATPPPY
jgi:predicted lipoprotein with Yx(FWY)xxD motif